LNCLTSLNCMNSLGFWRNQLSWSLKSLASIRFRDIEFRNFHNLVSFSNTLTPAWFEVQSKRVLKWKTNLHVLLHYKKRYRPNIQVEKMLLHFLLFISLSIRDGILKEKSNNTIVLVSCSIKGLYNRVGWRRGKCYSPQGGYVGDERQVSQGSNKTTYQLLVPVVSTQCTFYQVSQNRRVQDAKTSGRKQFEKCQVWEALTLTVITQYDTFFEHCVVISSRWQR